MVNFVCMTGSDYSKFRRGLNSRNVFIPDRRTDAGAGLSGAGRAGRAGRADRSEKVGCGHISSVLFGIFLASTEIKDEVLYCLKKGE